MKYPALDVSGVDADRLQAIVDDFSPFAVDERADHVTVYFPDCVRRDAARLAVLASDSSASASAREVDDEDWARRSQESLTPITVGRVVVTPPWHTTAIAPADAAHPAASVQRLVISPSMGFGTGHHATTRLCLRALQSVELDDQVMLDVGTGSGVLALAARQLGAREATGIDVDPDAIQAAQENVALNPAIGRVRFLQADLRNVALPQADVVTANLTGALLVQCAAGLMDRVRPGGVLIVSGLLQHERDLVMRAFSPAPMVWESEEDGWVGLVFNREGATAV